MRKGNRISSIRERYIKKEAIMMSNERRKKVEPKPHLTHSRKRTFFGGTLQKNLGEREKMEEQEGILQKKRPSQFSQVQTFQKKNQKKEW